MGFKSKRGPDYDIDDNGILKYSMLWDAWTEIYTKTIDLRAFIKELATVMNTNKDVPFTDYMISGEDDMGYDKFYEGYGKGSEFTKTGEHWNRGDNFYEKEFSWMKYPGCSECEFVWKAKAKTKYSNFGWVEFKMDLVCRRILDVEVVVNGKKKIMQKGSWEFRNTLHYYNSYVKNQLMKIPFVSSSNELQRLMFDHAYFPTIKRDIAFVDAKVKPIIWNVIYKHFK